MMSVPQSTEADRAAVAIQAASRGRTARLRVSSGNDVSPSTPVTAEIIRLIAAEHLGHSARCVSLGPQGLRVAGTKLSATGRRLTGSLRGTLGKVPHLTALDLSDNRLASLAGLESLPALSSLVVRGNRLMGVLDYPCPRSGSRLRHADLRENVIAGAVSLPADDEGRARGLDAHPRVETLHVDDNRLRSLRGLGVATHLTEFSASNNQLQDTAGLAGLALRTLNLNGNDLVAAEELSQLRSLRTLRLSHNQLTALPILTSISSLVMLEVAHNQLASLEALAEAVGPTTTSLRSLTIEDNPCVVCLTDARLRVIYAIQSVSTLNGMDVTAEELVAARNMHGDDAQQLTDIRRRLFPHEFISQVNHEHAMPALLTLYRAQYTAAFAAEHVAHTSK
jgi:hypothetical protein